MELCSSLCSCPLLAQMHDNFVRKFKVFPNPCVEVLAYNGKTKGEEGKSVESHADRCDDDGGSMLGSDELNNALDEPIAGISGDEEDEECGIALDGGLLDYEIVDQESRTPVPVYEMMSETELNAELAKYGHGPMGRRAAIKLLNRIFEATHPALSETTPLPRKIIRAYVSDVEPKGNDQARQKRARQKINQLMGRGNNNTEGSRECRENGEIGEQRATAVANLEISDQGEQRKKNDIALTQIFLGWLREPANGQLYTELLLLNPVFFDKLYNSFKRDMDDLKCSKEVFTEMLDKLGITYCSRNDLSENQ